MKKRKKSKKKVKPHKTLSKRGCKLCRKAHSKHAHKSHGKGSYKRTHPLWAALGF